MKVDRVYRNACQRRWYARNREKVAISVRRWKENNRGKVLGYQRRWKNRNAEKVLAYTRRRKYGLTEEHFKSMFVAQNGCCASCGDPLLPGRGTHVHHSHETNKILGLLCRGCNIGLGHFRDDLGRLLKAVAFLQKVKP